ncbi:MAG: LuxR C-terminal-related transcriptional regulator [Pseudomonadota bacterium]
MTAQIARVKIRAPLTRSEEVARTRCLDRLSEVKSGAIAAIVAGAGAGKTTVLKQMLMREREAGAQCVWLSLDEGDDTAPAAWALLLCGLSEIDPTLTTGLAERLDAHDEEHKAAIDRLSNQLIAHGGPISLFIDDAHFATGGAAKLLRKLVQCQPPNLKIFLASRESPALPLSELRVRNRLRLLHWDDLAFNAEEATAFFEALDRCELSEDLAQEIHKKTEGWPAGLQLAHLGLQLNADAHAVIRALTGERQDAAAYFEEQIYGALPEELQQFLLNTSVLDRLSDPLAATVADVPPAEARRRFDALEARGFFIAALDEGRSWRRYHHLFQQFLTQILYAEDPERARRLLMKASAWFEAEGDFSAAIAYAMRAEEFERACDLVEAHATELFNEGAVAPLAAWIGLIPKAVMVRRPRLPLYLCFLFAHMNETTAAIIRQYEASRVTIDTLRAVGHFASEDEYQRLRADLEAVSVIVDFRGGDMEEVRRRSEIVCQNEEQLSPVFRASLHNVCGFAHLALGDSAAAKDELRQAYELHLAEGCTIGVVYAECFRGMADFVEGRTSEAATHFTQAERYAADHVQADAPLASTASLYSASLNYELNAFGGLIEELPAHLERIKDFCEPDIYANALLVHYNLLRIAERRAEADRVLERAVDYALNSGHTALHLRALYAKLMRLMDADDTQEAMAVFRTAQAVWSDAGAADSGVWSRVALWSDLIRAEVLQATGRPRAAIDIWETLADRCQRRGRVYRSIFVLSKLGIGFASVGETRDALAAMGRAIKLSERSGFVRPILDAGRGVEDLIRLWAAETDAPSLACYGDALLAAAAPDAPAPVSPAASERIVLQELTNRELEILKRLVAGAKNREICADLNLAENTVKWYLKRVFNKLGVSNRTEAALFAKSLFAAL